MKEASLHGVKREDLGKGASGRMRKEGVIPCVVTRQDENINFSAFINDFDAIVYTPDTFLVNITVDGKTYKTLIQEVQFNPLSDEVLHVDFLEVRDGVAVNCELPIAITGNSPGVQAGGKLVSKMRKLKVRGMVKDMPDAIPVSIEGLGLGKSVKVKDVNVDAIEILNSASLPIATVDIPRALKGKKTEEQ